MNIDNYIKAILPIIVHCRKDQKLHPKTYKKTQLWYLYRQTFYGFNEFIDWEAKCFASQAAQKEYLKLKDLDDIRKRKRYEQHVFDGTSRYNGKFILEHIYSGNMFRNAINKIPIDKISVSVIKEIIEKNYSVAWILKTEDKILGRKLRGVTIDDALEYYKDKKIELI